jgi:uncharacterized protein (TIGR03435 family)
VAALIACAALSSSVLAQSADSGTGRTARLPEFEAATIKPHTPGELVGPEGGLPGSFEAKNVTAKMLVELAFNVPRNQVFGGPPWIESQVFDVKATISDEQWQTLNKLDYDSRNQSIQQMLQSLMNRRFQLVVSHQPKDLMVFALVVSKSRSKLRVAGTPEPPELRDSRELAMAMDQHDVPVSALASFLSGRFGRMVLDCTGLSRRYDISLRVEIPDENSPDAVDSAIFRALEDQLGLKLVTRREVLDTIVIDHLEQPSEN